MVDDEERLNSGSASDEERPSPDEQADVEEGDASAAPIEEADADADDSRTGTASGRVKKRARPKAASTSKRIRDLRRHLERFGEQMPPGAKRAREEELEGLLALSAERTRRTAETANAKKYRMVKFFDRRKCERRLRSDDAVVRAQAARDLRYVDEYPRDAKYIALFPKGGHTPQSRAQLDAMRARIECDNAVETGMRDVEPNSSPPPAPAIDDGDDFFLPG